MFELLKFDAFTSGRPHEGTAFLSELKAMKANGERRVVTNRRYFQWWSDRSVAEVEALGHKWFKEAHERLGEDILYESVRDRIRDHQNSGHRIVFVSGSFVPALSPLAAMLGVDQILVADLWVEDGRYTGEISEPMIGEGKRTAVLLHAAEQGICLADSFGYGDDHSDIPFMEVTGRPVAVGVPNAAFLASAADRGWDHLHCGWK